MPRRVSDGSTRMLVYRAHVKPTGSASARRQLLDNPDWIKQLRLAHELRNALVEIEHGHEESLRALWLSNQRVVDAEASLARADETVAELVTQARREHSSDRSVATRSATAQEIKEARAARRQAAATRRSVLADVRSGMKEAERELEGQRRAAIKATYAEFVQGHGLYWATYNQVKDNHFTAARRVLQARAQGRPARLRFKRWDATGTIAVQLARCAGDPQRTPQQLASGKGKWRNVLRLGAWMDPAEFRVLPQSERRRVARCEIGWQLGNKTMITLPVEFSRMIPPEADITNAMLAVTRVGDQRKATVYLTARVPAPPPREEGPLVAVHVGWRMRDDGSVRVATWASTGELPRPNRGFPEFVQTAVHRHAGGRSGEIIVPSRWLDDVAKADSLRAIRGKELLRIRERVAKYLDQWPQPDPVEDDPDRPLSGDRIRLWRSAGRLARLAMHWRNQPPQPHGHSIAAELEAWRKQDRHLWSFETGVRSNPQHHRREVYRCVAAWIVAHVGTVATDDTHVEHLLRREDVAENEPALPGHVATEVRARARVVSPGDLRATIRAAAKRSGVTDITVGADHLTRRHHH